MSLLGKITSAASGLFQKAAPVLGTLGTVASLIPGVGTVAGIAGKAVGALGAIGSFAKAKPLVTGAIAAGGLATAGGLAAAVHRAGTSPAAGAPRGRTISVRPDGSVTVHRRRGKGLSGRDLKGFNRTIHLLKKVGMVPRKLSHARTRRTVH